MSDEVKCWELLDSMSGSVTNESEQGELREVKRRFLIGQCEGFNDAVDKIEPYAPSYVETDGSGLYWVRMRLEVVSVGNKYFDCSATYKTLQPKKSNKEPENGGGDGVPGAVSWDTAGHTEHKTQALSEDRYGTDAPNFERAINVSGTSVQGIDVISPGMKYSETWIFPLEIAMSCDYIGSVYSLTGTVNKDPFRCFEEGECLFLGARAQWQGDQPYVSITFEFEARKNSTVDLSVYGGPIAGVTFEKKGWDYVWFLYGTNEDKDVLVKHPVAAYKNKIYEEEAWTGLLIAEPPAQPLAPVPPQNPNQPGQAGAPGP